MSTNEDAVTSSGVSHVVTAPPSLEHEHLASSTYTRWPFPSWTMFDPDKTRWDAIGQRNVRFFYECLHYPSPGRRTGLYSTESPPGIYIIEDSGEFGSPPEAAGVPLSCDELWPRMDPSWLRYDGPYFHNLAEDHGPNWLKDIGDIDTKEDMLAEISVLELLRRFPHPNFPVYLGCLVENDCPWVTGVVLKRYPKRLHDMALNGEITAASKERIVAELESAIAHLHSHGLAHNDISPYNTMLDDDSRVVLIDFGSCFPFGQPIPTRGTPGFCVGDWSISDPEHDVYGLDAVRRFLDDSVQPKME